MDGLAILLALIALIVAFGARRGGAALQAKLIAIQDELRSLRAQVAALGPVPPASPSAGPALAEPPPPLQPAPVETPIAASEPVAAEPETPPAARQPAAPAATLEERLGTRWAVWVGGLALALGGVLLVRYSIEQGIFSPGVRVLLGVVFSLALLAAGELSRRTESVSPETTLKT